MNKTFDDATFYTIIELEEHCLHHKTPEDCLAEHFGEDEEVWRKTLDQYEDPVVVVAYEPRVVEPSWIERMAECIVETLDEEWDEEYGGGDEPMSPKGEARREVLDAARAAVAKYVAVTKVWQCEEVGQRDYSHARIIEILKERHPDWDWNDET